MSKEILINCEPSETRVAVMRQGHLEEFYVERSGDKTITGNIYKGRVKSVIAGIGAAFVDIGQKKNGFLYISDIVEPGGPLAEDVQYEDTAKPAGRKSIMDLVKKGEEVTVQIVKEPLGTKGARLTTHISIPGRLMVLMPMDDKIGISKRIESEAERRRLRTVLRSIKFAKDIGIVVRTVAEGASEKELVRELKFLLNQWQKIQARSRKARQVPSLLYEELGLTERVCRDVLSGEVAEIICDSKQEYRKLAYFLARFAPALRSKLQLHRHPQPLFERKHAERQIQAIFQRRVELKSGGYIIIEPTEALVAIDVNSGKFIGKRNADETILITNKEAAQEIARQLRLRDLGGIIIIDFIDMSKSSHRRDVIQTLEKALEPDKAKIKVLDISRIGLVEMTRQRSRRSLESLYYEDCPQCHGRGLVKSAESMAIIALRQIEQAVGNNQRRMIDVSAHPSVAERLLAREKPALSNIEREHKSRINIHQDPALHVEDVKVKIS